MVCKPCTTILRFVGMTSSEPSVTHVIPKGNQVGGVTSLGDDVFVVRFERQQIEVYDAVTFTLQRSLAVPELGSRSLGLAVCPSNNCLYASDWENNDVHRIELSGSNAVTKWSVARSPAGLSVNRAQSLIVVSNGERKLQEFTTHGTLLQNIQLQLGTESPNPWHAIHLASDQFAVCCRESLNGLCLVDSRGAVIRSYGGHKGSQVMNMKSPASLAVDKYESILVADMLNNKLLVLDRSLASAHEMSVSVDGGLKGPRSLWYDKSRGRLYIGEWDGGRLIVIDYLNNFDTARV